MNHQLVLRFRKSTFERPEDVAAMEAALAAALGELAQLDGHDIGKRDLDLFLATPDPAAAFRRCKRTLEDLLLLERVVVAHRVEGGARFTVIWPLGYGRKFALAHG